MYKLIILCAALAFSVAAFAVPQAQFPGGTITLTKEACKLKELLTLVKPEYKSKMLRAKVKYQGKDIEACYTIIQGEVQGADEFFNQFVFDVMDFTDVKEI